MTDLVTITTKGGARFTVAKSGAQKFEGLLNDLEAAGYPIKGDQSGGYNYRTIAGTNKLSNHAHGSAVDVNWSDNPRGGMGNIPAETASALAQKYGMTWGGDWKNPDPMHFEVASAPVPQNATVAGVVPVSAPVGAPGSNGLPDSNSGLPGLDTVLPGGPAGELAKAFGSLTPKQGQQNPNEQLADAALQYVSQVQPMQLTGRRMAQAPDVERIRRAVRGRLGIMGA